MEKKSIRRDILKSAFDRAKNQNPKFSLRSLAAKLNLSPAFVSKILNGKSELPLERVDDFVRSLKMDKMSRSLLLETYLHENLMHVARSAKGAKSKSYPYEEMGDKNFHLLQEWYLIPILDYFSLEGAAMDENQIARAFGLPVPRVQAALAFLIENKYLAQQTNGTWRKTKYKVRLPTERSREMIRDYHAKLMQLAIQTLKTQTDQAQFDRRLISGISVATNSANIELAIKKLNEAMYEVADILAAGACDQVYHLNVQLFPLTKG